MNLTEQGYYNLVIYESDPEDFAQLFEPTKKNELVDHLDDMETALDYISDRMGAGLHDHITIDDKSIDSEDLYMKALHLEELRKTALGEEYEPHIDLNVILH